MSEINRLSQCERLSEFKDFIEKLNVDETSSGRKFIYADPEGNKRTYTMNQIIRRFEICVPKSISNQTLLESTALKITGLSDAATTHAETHGCMLGMRQAFGNWWYSVTHDGFDKETALTNITNMTTKGREDLSVDTINVENNEGKLPLELLLDDPKRDYHRDVKELLGNGAIPNDSAYFQFFNRGVVGGSLEPLKALYSSIDIPTLNRQICLRYNTSLNENLKELLVEIVRERSGSCLGFLYLLNQESQKDFLQAFVKYACTDPSQVDFSQQDADGAYLKDYAKRHLTAEEYAGFCERMAIVEPQPQ